MAKRVETPTEDAAPHGDGGQANARAATPWRGGFAGPFSSMRLAAQRLGRSWRLLLAVELGMVIAVALLATAPFYSDLVASAQLQTTLLNSASSDRNLEVDVTVGTLYAPGSPAVDRVNAIDQTVTADMSTYAASFTSGSTEYLQTTRALSLTKVNGKDVSVALPEYPVNQGAQDLPMAFNYTQALPHMKLFAGRLPRDTAASAMPEVMVTPAMGVKPGATLHLVDAQFPKYGFNARVVGVWFPKDESDPFWNDHGFDTVNAPNVSNPPAPQYPVLFTRQTFVQIFSFPPTQKRLPIGVGLHYIYFVAPDQIAVSQAHTISQQLTALRTALNADVPGQNGVFQVGVATHLGDLLNSVTSLLAGQALPLYSVDAQLVALALLFIFVMAGLLVESQSAEIATLKSRGASTTQVLLTYLSQGVLLGAVSLVVGVMVAGGLALALVRYFVPLAHAVSALLTPAYVARTLSLRDALLPAAVGAGLGVVALALAAWQAARMDALAFRREQGRSERVPFWKRYYLDIALTILCVAGYIELSTFGGLTTRTQLNSLNAQSGASQADLIQLLAPTLMLLAGALLLQRALP
ncbi:MAG TPA: FtsX-like permease family protein, partial [Ktedonobacterales bacterium]|nr:FtsX-like permease family protein [Ktedonobacterales bacterium]